MAGFEPESSVIGGDRSANCANEVQTQITTLAHFHLKWIVLVMETDRHLHARN